MKLGGYRGQLESKYNAPQARNAVDSVKAYEQRVQDAIDKLTAQKEKIQSYLDNMNKADTEIVGQYNQELQTAQHVFD